MGKKSIKKDKNIYFQSRENANLTREEASELLGLSEDRIERIENRGVTPYPEEILVMAEHYNNPKLCNYYCTHECRIGQEMVPEIEDKDLPTIILETIATLNALGKDKDRIAEISYDGKITKDEIKDFKKFKTELEKMSLIVDSLKLWADKAVMTGELDNSILHNQ